MQSYKKMYGGKFLKKTDTSTAGERTVIESIDEEKVDPEKPTKLVASLRGFEKKLVMNVTNCETLEEITGSDNPDDWIGTKVTIFNDPSVSFNGERGGLRLKAASPKKSVLVEEDPFDEDDD